MKAYEGVDLALIYGGSQLVGAEGAVGAQEIERESSAVPAVRSGITVWNGQVSVVAPSLEYLGEPGLENDHVAILADAFGNGKSVEEVDRHDLGKSASHKWQWRSQ
jgi:hypothetical protein